MLELAPIAIEARDLGVRYRRYTRKAMTLKESLLSLFTATHFEEFWGVRGVDLTIRRGESVGVIGLNGSGKSTLLKAIARVLPPSEGSVRVAGSVAPLLELGGGFNPELTGRENIFLNGAIMGRSQKEMRDKLSRIIDFADIGDFIDAPLSTYSSGMRARLGFAVATDVDPEVLLVDEILSVGDASFADKARERLHGFFAGQKTVVLVSHSLPTVRELCRRVIYLSRGQIVADGAPDEVLARYEADVAAQKLQRTGTR